MLEKRSDVPKLKEFSSFWRDGISISLINVLFVENFRYKYDKTLGLHSADKGNYFLFVWRLWRLERGCSVLYHRLTVARRTVISSGFPPSVSMPAARAFTAKGDKNWKSKKNLVVKCFLSESLSTYFRIFWQLAGHQSDGIRWLL